MTVGRQMRIQPAITNMKETILILAYGVVASLFFGVHCDRAANVGYFCLVMMALACIFWPVTLLISFTLWSLKLGPFEE